MVGYISGLMVDGRKDGWMCGRMDGWIYIYDGWINE